MPPSQFPSKGQRRLVNNSHAGAAVQTPDGRALMTTDGDWYLRQTARGGTFKDWCSKLDTVRGTPRATTVFPWAYRNLHAAYTSWKVNLFSLAKRGH